MAITSKFLKGIEAEARPIIERQLNDAKIIAGLRDVVSAAGGDWGALKALIKARVEDDNDEAGEGKRVRKIREKADCTVAYDDMLGSNMNEKNFSASQSYAEAKGRETTTPKASNSKASSAETGDLTTAPSELTDTQEQPETRADNGANIVTRHLNINVPPSPANAPRLSIADDEAAQANPTSSAPHSNPLPTLLPGAGKAEAVTPPPASASHFDNPRCKSPDGCTFAHSRNSCWECTMAWATRPKDEQVRLWQEAMEAASETEAA